LGVVLTVQRAERAAIKVDALADLLRAPAADPFAPEVISVPAKGVERWLAQRLSTSLGVAANIAFPHPNRLVAGALAAAQGIELDDDPWAPSRLVWTLLRVIDAKDGGRALPARTRCACWSSSARWS
jgi:exodeoxyribonuclease V gamma subunit